MRRRGGRSRRRGASCRGAIASAQISDGNVLREGKIATETQLFLTTRFLLDETKKQENKKERAVRVKIQS